MARPLKKITVTPEQYIFDMAEKQCTQTEIASALEISVDTLERRYADIYRSGKESGKAKLRTKLFAEAMTGVPQILVFVAKNYLGMADKVSQEISGPNGSAIQIDDAHTQLTSKLDSLIARHGTGIVPEHPDEP